MNEIQTSLLALRREFNTLQKQYLDYSNASIAKIAQLEKITKLQRETQETLTTTIQLMGKNLSRCQKEIDELQAKREIKVVKKSWWEQLLK